MANSDSSVLQETILRAMDAVVTQRNNELKLDKTVTAIVKKNVGIRNNRPLYEVEYEGGRLVATAQNSTDSYVPNTSVYVLVPQGNFSNEKIIIGRASSINTDRSASVVAAAANSYSIIGSNLIKSTSATKVKDIQYGLHSFHNAADESNTGHSTDHRFQILYSKEDDDNSEKKITFNDSNLDIYKEQATALMLKAEFQTNLDVSQKRQPGARYGLIFNFSFDNLNKGFGETNEKIFDAIAPAVKGKVIKVGTSNSSEKFLSDYKISNNFDDDVISSYIEYVKMIADNYEIVDKKEKINKELVDNLITAYLTLLNNLYTIAKANRQTEYTQWKNEKVGQPSEKIESFMLTSDMMLGNPLGFSQWNTQYSVFSIDMNTFNHLDSIYFFKEGFIENTEAENNWPIGEGGSPDIFVKNIQIYAMKPLEAQSGDYSLKVEPYGDNDFILSSANESTRVTAVVMRMLSENLTYNSNVEYYWFKENSSVVNSSSEGYNYLAGPGWKKLTHKESGYLFTTTIQDNPAYKNNYKCVAVYRPASDDEIILSVSFTIYNENAALKIKLESDIGTEFTFNAGTPIIKVLIQEKNKNNYKEIDFNTNKNNTKYRYRYIWAITEDNGQKIFLTDNVEEKNQNFLLARRQSSLLDRISYYALSGTNVISVNNSYSATRIKYPVYATSKGFTVNCYVQRGKVVSNEVQQYFDVGSAQLEFINKDEDLNVSAFHIEIENGDQVFQYDEYGNSPIATKLKQPLEIQPIRAKLINRSGLEVEGSNYLVEWIFPIENTLLISKEALVENNASQLVQSYWGRECNFSIQNIYNPDFYNNQITCHISFGNNDLYKDTNFYFGKVGGNGTNGTDVIAKIEYAKEDAINRLHSEPLTLYVQKGSNGAKFNVLDSSNTLNTLRTSQVLVGNTSLLQLKLYQKNEEIPASQYASGYPKWNLAGNSNGTTNTQGKYFNLINDSSTDDPNNLLTWNYNSKSNNPYRLQNIKAEVKLKTGETYYAYFSLPIIEYESGQSLNTKLHKDTIAIDKATYLNEIVYNADGRNPVYNHNAGLKLINLPKGVTVTWTAKGGFNSTESTPSISLIKSKNEETRWPSYTTSVINSGTAMTYVLPADNYTGRATNNRIEAVIKQGSTVIATVYAPINMTLNTFGLASINAWDGNSITIDEDNGAVLAPQIGAGEKDSNNRFTGIVMGKTETYTGGAEKEKQIGLFGYANGLQSIFLDSETGNATFGLPDPDTNGKYRNTSRAAGDNYNEGRIELRPGGESKIGGWKIGRRSLYYTMEKKSGSWTYSGKIGNSYNDEWATNHIKDIEHEHQGILLDPSYISIKGRPLTVGQGSAYDIDDTSGNAALNSGDSLELNLDPNQKSFFTIFRHYKDNNSWKRKPLVGIDALGRFYTNALQDQETSLNMNYVAGFGKTAREEKYVGLNIGYGARTIFKAFINAVNSQETDTLYFSGGKLNNEYVRPLSLHGSSIKLYASSDASTSATPKYNIQISQSSGQINLDDDTGLHLYTSSGSANSLKTAGPLSINIGTSNNRKNLTINANTTTATIGSATVNNSGATEVTTKGVTITNSGATTINNTSTTSTTTINNAGSVSITNASSTTLSSKGNIALYRRNNSNEIESELLLRDRDSTAYFGIPTIKDGETVIRRGYISLSGKETETSTWSTLGPINLISTNNDNAILIHANCLGDGVNHNGTTKPQLELRAGTGSNLARILLSSSNNNWVNVEGSGSLIGGKYRTDGEPFRVQYGSQGISIKTNVIGNTRFYNFCTDMSIRAAGGIILTGGLSAPEKSDASNYGLWSVKGLHTEFGGNNNSDKILSFASTQFKGTQSNSYSITTTNLKAAIDYCLRAATDAWDKANAAQATADNAVGSINKLGSAAWKNEGDFRSSSWYPDLSGYATTSALDDYVTKDTYKNHTHSPGNSSGFVTTTSQLYISNNSIINQGRVATTGVPN